MPRYALAAYDAEGLFCGYYSGGTIDTLTFNLKRASWSPTLQAATECLPSVQLHWKHYQLEVEKLRPTRDTDKDAWRDGEGDIRHPSRSGLHETERPPGFKGAVTTPRDTHTHTHIDSSSHTGISSKSPAPEPTAEGRKEDTMAIKRKSEAVAAAPTEDEKPRDKTAKLVSTKGRKPAESGNGHAKGGKVPQAAAGDGDTDEGTGPYCLCNCGHRTSGPGKAFRKGHYKAFESKLNRVQTGDLAPDKAFGKRQATKMQFKPYKKGFKMGLKSYQELL